MKTFGAVVLVLPLLSGCFGGGGADAGGDDSTTDPTVPTLPDDLSMDGAEVIHRDETSVRFRWEGTTEPSIYHDAAGGRIHGAAPRAAFDLSPEIRLDVYAVLTYEVQPGASLALFLIGPEAAGSDQAAHAECVDSAWNLLDPDLQVNPADMAVRRCVAAMGPSPGRGEVLVYPDPNPAGAIDFAVDLTLTVRRPVYDWAELHGVAEIVPYEVMADDGVALRGHVYLPDAEGPYATVLEYSPYWNTVYGHSENWGHETADGRTTLQDWLGPLMDAGFAVALVNMRGWGESGGCFQWSGPRDAQDVAEVIESLAAEDWSNGNIGMIGQSYPGWTQDLAVASGTPSLKAVVPMSPVQDFWSLLTRAGAPIWDAIALTFGFHTAFNAGILATLEDGEPGDQRPEQYACPEYAMYEEEFARLVDSGDKTAFWRERDLREGMNRTTVPTLASVGLQFEGHIHQLDGRWDRLAGPKHFFLGQHGHARPSEVRADWNDLVVAFLDHHLRGGPAPWPANHVEYQSDDGLWHTATRWPPDGSTATLYVSDGALVAEAAAVSESRSMFQSTYDAPVPVDCPGTQVLYASEPVAEDVRLAGNFHVSLTLESTMPDGNLAAYIYQVPDVAPCDPDRFAEARAVAAQNDHATNPGEVRRAMSDLRHRGFLEIGRDFPVTGTDTVHLMSYPFATTIKAGHRIVLGISGGAPDLVDEPRKPVITVHTGPRIVGEVVLPVVEGELRFQGT